MLGLASAKSWQTNSTTLLESVSSSKYKFLEERTVSSSFLYTQHLAQSTYPGNSEWVNKWIAFFVKTIQECKFMSCLGWLGLPDLVWILWLQSGLMVMAPSTWTPICVGVGGMLNESWGASTYTATNEYNWCTKADVPLYTFQRTALAKWYRCLAT